MKAGQRWIVTTGAYSDYGIRDSFVVLKEFSFDKTLAKWLEAHGERRGGKVRFGYGANDDQAFLARLRADGLVADEQLNELHLSDYSEPVTNPAGDAGDES